MKKLMLPKECSVIGKINGIHVLKVGISSIPSEVFAHLYRNGFEPLSRDQFNDTAIQAGLALLKDAKGPDYCVPLCKDNAVGPKTAGFPVFFPRTGTKGVLASHALDRVGTGQSPDLFYLVYVLRRPKIKLFPYSEKLKLELELELELELSTKATIPAPKPLAVAASKPRVPRGSRSVGVRKTATRKKTLSLTTQ